MTAQTRRLLEDLEREWGAIVVDDSARSVGRVTLMAGSQADRNERRQKTVELEHDPGWKAHRVAVARGLWSLYDRFREHDIEVAPPALPRPDAIERKT